jgi:hypothetical protein
MLVTPTIKADSMLTIPMNATPAPDAQRSATGQSVLVIGRSEKVLRETVDLLRADGHLAGATNELDHVLARFDATCLSIVVFGGMVPPQTRERLLGALARANPTIVFVQGYSGIPGLLAAQVQAAGARSDPRTGSVTYDSARRALTIALRTHAHVCVVGFWGTAFVPPDPESTSQVIFDETLAPGSHTLALPSVIPASASFLAVHVGTDVHPLIVGPMPAGTTLAATAP